MNRLHSSPGYGEGPWRCAFAPGACRSPGPPEGRQPSTTQLYYQHCLYARLEEIPDCGLAKAAHSLRAPLDCGPRRIVPLTGQSATVPATRNQGDRFGHTPALGQAFLWGGPASDRWWLIDSAFSVADTGAERCLVHSRPVSSQTPATWGVRSLRIVRRTAEATAVSTTTPCARAREVLYSQDCSVWSGLWRRGARLRESDATRQKTPDSLRAISRD
jgi:hypothetical protein